MSAKRRDPLKKRTRWFKGERAVWCCRFPPLLCAPCLDQSPLFILFFYVNLPLVYSLLYLFKACNQNQMNQGNEFLFSLVLCDSLSLSLSLSLDSLHLLHNSHNGLNKSHSLSVKMSIQYMGRWLKELRM